jgi:hypothetical protein
MMSRHWSWIGACSTGSSHIRAGTSCQDFATCIEIPFKQGTALIAIVSDGAGSAEFSAIGSRTVVRCLSRQLVNYARLEESSETISEETARQWLDDVRDRISIYADAKASTPREFAATLVAAIVFPNQMTVCHVGDGACAVRKQGNQEWEVASWPAHGEYASSTYFVTDDPEPALRLSNWEGEFTDIAIFSDGLERLALDFQNKRAFNRFFNPMSAPLVGRPPGRGRTLSAQLRKFLNGSQVTDRTDDDKSLVVASRVPMQ